MQTVLDRQPLQIRQLAERGCDLFANGLLPLRSPSESFHVAGFGELLDQIVTARRLSRPVVLILGGHPIKLGLSRYLVDLIERRIVTHLATNGSGLIHDYELAAHGGTSENVARCRVRGALPNGALRTRHSSAQRRHFAGRQIGLRNAPSEKHHVLHAPYAERPGNSACGARRAASPTSSPNPSPPAPLPRRGEASQKAKGWARRSAGPSRKSACRTAT
jgi:hypothetical protein